MTDEPSPTGEPRRKGRRQATAPGTEASSETPGKRPRSPWLIPTIIVVAVGVAVVLVLEFVPIPQQLALAYAVPDPGGPTCGNSPQFTFPHAGTLDVSWSTNNSEKVSLYLDGPQGKTVWSRVGTRGSDSISVHGGEAYYFLTCTSASESSATTYLNGTLHYNAPWL